MQRTVPYHLPLSRVFEHDYVTLGPCHDYGKLVQGDVWDRFQVQFHNHCRIKLGSKSRQIRTQSSNREPIPGLSMVLARLGPCITINQRYEDSRILYALILARPESAYLACSHVLVARRVWHRAPIICFVSRVSTNRTTVR
jgi:hypothetical protein